MCSGSLSCVYDCGPSLNLTWMPQKLFPGLMPAALFCRNIGVRLKYPPVVFLANANNTQASVENIEYSTGLRTLYIKVMSTEQVPNFCSERESPEDMRVFSKERAESCGDSAPERTWQSHGPQSPAALQ